MSKKRGQTTIFMLLAIVVLLIGVLFFFSQDASLEKTEYISPELVPIKNFVDTCISDTAARGIAILGLNGGYINFPQQINSNPRSYLKFTPLDDYKNPYWWYDGTESIPTEEFMVKQIEDYIISEIGTCINNFEVFSSQFDVKKLSETKVNVILNEDDVSVELNYPAELTNKLNRTKIEIDNFRKKIPIRLKKAYEMAKDIMDAENRDFFLEFKTIDLITMDEDIPTTDVVATCQEKTWPVSQVKAKLQRLLNANLPYINVVGSDFDDNIFVSNPFGEDTYKDSYYNYHYLWKIADKDYNNMRVSFDYDERWPMQFYARPSKGGILKSNSQKGQDMLKFFCIHIWHFTYDAIYPVKATIMDTSGINPYQFSFAFKVQVDHNQPNRQNFAATIFEGRDVGNEEDYCNDLYNELTIYTLSETTNEDIADVNLTLTCGRFTCNIGKSDWISFGAAAALTAQAPYCVNGILRGKKQGFEDTEMFIQADEDREYTLYMEPVKELDYYVVKHDFDNPFFEDRIKDEQASITIKSATDDFEAFGIYPDNENFPIKLPYKDDQYEVTIYLMDNEDIIGGYQGTWNVNLDQLQANTIKFHVLEKQGNENDRFLFVSGLSSYSDKVSAPELV